MRPVKKHHKPYEGTYCKKQTSHSMSKHGHSVRIVEKPVCPTFRLGTQKNEKNDKEWGKQELPLAVRWGTTGNIGRCFGCVRTVPATITENEERMTFFQALVQHNNGWGPAS